MRAPPTRRYIASLAMVGTALKRIRRQREKSRQPVLYSFQLVLQRIFSSTLTKQRQPLLPVREIRNVIPSRIVADERQCMRGCQGFARQHCDHQEARLREGQGRRFF